MYFWDSFSAAGYLPLGLFVSNDWTRLLDLFYYVYSRKLQGSFFRWEISSILVGTVTLLAYENFPVLMFIYLKWLLGIPQYRVTTLIVFIHWNPFSFANDPVTTYV